MHPLLPQSAREFLADLAIVMLVIRSFLVFQLIALILASQCAVSTCTRR